MARCCRSCSRWSAGAVRPLTWRCGSSRKIPGNGSRRCGKRCRTCCCRCCCARPTRSATATIPTMWCAISCSSRRGLRFRLGKAERQDLQRARDQEAGSLRCDRGNSADRELTGTVVPPARCLGRRRGGSGDRGFHPVRIGSNVFVRLEIMYKSFYNLQRNPFEITPDPSFLFPTTRHNEALASLYYGVTAHRGFVVLTGEVGTGKTLILRSLLGLLQRRDVAFALIFNPTLSPLEFMRYIAGDFGLQVGCNEI